MEAQPLGAATEAPRSYPAVPEVRYAVAIVEPDPRLRMVLGARLPAAQQFDSIEALTQVLRAGSPTVGVFGPSMAGAFGFEQVHRLVTVYPELGAVFVAYELSAEVLQQALRAGARDAVQLDPGGEGVAQAVARVGEVLRAPQRAVAQAGAPASSALVATRVAPGRLVAVFSTKGGVGKSTVATNVATAMARRIDEPVALMDADMQFGDISVMLVEITGTYVGGMGGLPTGGDRPNYMLLGAIAKGPDAEWFFRATGPRTTLEPQRAAFEQMVRSIRRGQGA